MISGAVDAAYGQVRAAKVGQEKVEARVVELEAELRSLKSLLKRKESELLAERTRVENAEKELNSLRLDVVGLQKHIDEHKDEETVINEFKNSKDYDLALANAGAPEIERCWIIAEKYIKTDPMATCPSFIDKFLAAEKAIEEGKGEPEPFNGPSPSFLPAAQTSDNPNS